MPIDPNMKQLIDYYQSLKIPEFNKTTTASELRKMMKSFTQKATSELSPNIESIEDHYYDTDITEVRVRSYHPKFNRHKKPLVFFRSSGFVIDHFDDCNQFCCKLASTCETTVLAIDYPLAPEHPFPDPVRACYQTLLKLVSNADLFGIESTGFVMLGESSGACIAACLTQMLRDHHGPTVGYQILVCPITDHNFKTSSYKTMGRDFIITEDKIRWYFSQYFRNKSDINKLYALPMNAKDFSNLPKTLIVSAQYDPLCDDGKNYAKALESAGVACEYVCYNSLIHGFLRFNGIAASEQAFLDLTKKIKSFISKSAQKN